MDSREIWDHKNLYANINEDIPPVQARVQITE